MWVKMSFFSPERDISEMVMCGKVPAVYVTADFGCGSDVIEVFFNQRLLEPSGPLVNS